MGLGAFGGAYENCASGVPNGRTAAAESIVVIALLADDLSTAGRLETLG